MPQFEVQETLSDLYESALSWCRRSAKDLLENPINALAHVYPRAVKKNDTEIVLGRTVFAHVSAKQVFTEKVNEAKNISLVLHLYVVNLCFLFFLTCVQVGRRTRRPASR